MRASRLLSLLLLLQVRGRVPASALASEFGVSVRTIYRDVGALEDAGVPVLTEPGRSGGISLDRAYRSRLTGLTAAEAAALPLAGIASVARELGVGDEAAAALLKLLASLPADAGASAQRIARCFHLDPVPWYHCEEQLDCLPALAGAVWSARRVRIRYESWQREAWQTLDPLGLVQKGGLWYLVAAARGRVRSFRVASIRTLALTSAAAKRRQGFDLARYWHRWTREFESRLISGRATVLITEEGQRILRAVQPAAARIVADSQRPTDRPGWCEAQFPVESAAYTARQLLRLGSEVQVLEPAPLRQALRREASAVLAMTRPRGLRRVGAAG